MYFDGSIDHVWISFPEPPHHTHSASNLSKRPRSSTTVSTQPMTTQKKLFSYTRYDWNFLSTLSPTVLGWFCVLNRIKQPMKNFLEKREKHLDAVLTYFLVETKPISTLPESKLYELFTPKTKYLLSHPVSQVVTELRKHFNKNTQMHVNLQPNQIPDIQIIKTRYQRILSCLGENNLKRQPTIIILQPPSSSTTTSPMNSILPTNTSDQEQLITGTRTRTASVVDRVQRLIGHNDNTTADSAVRRRMTVQNSRSNTITRDTVVEMNKEPLSVPERRRASSFLGISLVNKEG